MVENTPPPSPHRKKLLWILTLLFLTIGLASFVFWFLVWRFEKTTSDAYVQGNQITITSQIFGYVTKVNVEDTTFVEEGQVLVTLDTLDGKIALDTAKSAMAETVRNVAMLFQNVEVLQAEKEMKKAQFAQTAKDYYHRKNLLDAGGVSKEDYQHAKTYFIAAFADLIATEHKLKAAKALVENTTIPTHPLVLKAGEKVKEAYINLQRCTIVSPSAGIVAMKKVQIGEAVSPQTPLLMVVPLDQIWVDANFKETQLKKVKLGQAVQLKADIYGSSVTYFGKVVGISAGTGSVMSLLPPQNATGNWIKIVQRLPVRIQLDPQQIQKHPLWLGLSMKTTIDITPGSEKHTVHLPPQTIRYSTTIFDKQEEGASVLIQEILRENSGLTL